MQISLSTSAIHQNLKKIGQQLSASYHYAYAENVSILTMTDNRVKGKISAISFVDFATLIFFDFAVNHEELHIHYHTKKEYHPLKLIYSFNATFSHLVFNHKLNYDLKAKTCSISSGFGEDQHGYIFWPHKHYQVAIIEINRDLYLHKMQISLNSLTPELMEIFDTSPGHPFFYLLRNHYKTEEGFSELFHLKIEGITSKLYLQAKVISLCALLLKIYQDEKTGEISAKNYSVYDINQFNTARRIIDNNLSNAPTIKELARQVALNENKLKKGFKELFDITIYQYVILQKMNKARALLQNEHELPISQVAERVGYRSKSQFTNRFKKHFQTLPNTFRKLH